MPTVSELQVVVSADTSKAEAGLSALGSKVGGIGGSIATAFGGAAIAGIAGLAAGFAATTVAAASFEAKMSAISAVSGATAGEMQQLTTLALDLGAATSFSASEAAEGIGELVKAGVSIADVMGGGAAAALNLAAAGGLSVAESAEIASNAMNVFSLKGADVGHVADVIAGAANASAIDVHDFGMSLAASGAVAATVGIGFDDLGTAIAVMGQAGIKGSDAGTSLKTMLLNLGGSSKEARSEMRELGIITADGANKFFDATGKARSMAEISEVLQNATANLTEKQKLSALQTMFGTDAIRAAAIMAKAGAEGFEEMAGSIGKVTASAVAAERLNNLKGDVEQLTGSVETAAIQIGMAFTPALREITKGATEMVNQAGPVLADFAEQASMSIRTASTQIQDAWRTAKQALAGQWLPSADIPPFVNNVGKAAIALKDLGDTVGKVAAKANELGTMDALNRGMESLKTNSTGIATNVEGLATALGRLAGAAGDSEQKINLVAAAVRLAAAGFENAVAVSSIIIDSVVQMGRTFVDFQTILLATGKALISWATGNKEAQMDAARVAGEAFQDMWNSSVEWKDRTAASAEGVKSALVGAGQAAGVLSSDVKAGTDGAAAAAEAGGVAIAAGVESGMAGATAAVETGAESMTAAMDTGMAGVVDAVESNAPAAVAGAEAMGTGMAAGIESAAPQMAAAAESGASGAVSAVQGQTGAASGAGQSLGQALGSGLEGGIMAYVGRVAAAAANLVSAAIGAAHVEADAHSPSKKTEQLGKDLAQGLEIGLNSSNLGAEMQRKIRDFIAASREYIPTAREISRVEQEIKDIRDKSQTDALFRAEKMITLDSEVLRLKAAAAVLERDAIGLRHELAAADREVADIQRGTLADRQRLIEIDAQRARNRLAEIGLQQQMMALEDEQAAAKEASTRRIAAAEQSLGDLRSRIDAEASARADRMNDVDSRALKLKRDLAQAEWNILPARQALEAATNRANDIERGSLVDRTALIQLDNQHSKIRLQQIDLEKQLLTVQAGSEQAKQIQAQIDALSNQDKYLQLEAERIRTTNDVAAMGAKIKAEGLADEVRGREKASQGTRNQSEILQAQQGIFAANEEIIRRSTDKELKSRQQLVDALKIEGTATNQRFEAIQKSIDALKRQNDTMQLEADRIKASNDLAAISARERREGLDDQVRGYDAVVGGIKNQIDVLGAERSVFEANENIIKNATDNEIAYRNRLIAVFTAEGKPLADRIAAGKAYLEQIHSEGKINDELYNAVKKVTEQSGAAATATSAMGTAAATAAPQLNQGATAADRMAQEAQDAANRARDAATQLQNMGNAASHLPSLFGPGYNFSMGHFAAGGRPPLNVPSIVGERGPELFVPDRPGTILPAEQWGSGGPGGSAHQTMRVDVAIGGRVAESIYIEGRQLAIRRGRVPSGSA